MNTSSAITTAAAAAVRPMVGHVNAPACEKRNERIGQPDMTGTGGPAKE